MKKSFMVLVLLLVVGMVLPAFALENQFGGYWRTRAFTDKNFTGEDESKDYDLDRIDTRTRLFYTAKFSDNLKFVNKFEMNAVWGGAGTYGQLGADGANVVVKHSYVNFKLSDHDFRVGIQDYTVARGYIFDDDAAGFKAIFKATDNIYLPILYIKGYEGGTGKINGKSADDYDVNAWMFYPTVFLNKETTLKPHFTYWQTDDFTRATAQGAPLSVKIPGATKLDLYTAGLEFDTKFDAFTIGATGIFEFGSVDVPTASYKKDSLDFKGYLFDLFGSMEVGPATLRIKGIYASGNKEDSTANGEYKAFYNPGGSGTGASYYWAEIMGYGIFDALGVATADDPTGEFSDKISNRIIGNIGATFKVLPNLEVAADLWYAKTAEDVMLTNGQYGDTLGTELDIVVSYAITEELKLDLVGAYLWADDVVNKAIYTSNAANPYEFGVQLSLEF